MKKESTLYFFYTTGCGWCNKAMPFIDELNKEGYEILKLDLADGDNRKLQEEVKKEYKHQCGTPYFVDAETGNTICGFRDKDVLKKWADGEEIPQPARPTGPPPKLPLHGASKEEEDAWKKEYAKWFEKNKELPNVKPADELLKLPRPKTDPPKPPAQGADDKAVDDWVVDYEKWKSENEHLPGLLEGKAIAERFKAARDGQQMPGGPNQPPSPVGGGLNAEAETRITRIEQKLDMLMRHLGVRDTSPMNPNIPKQPVAPNKPAVPNKQVVPKKAAVKKEIKKPKSKVK